MIKVRLEAVPVLSETLGIEVVSDQEIERDSSVKDFLNILCNKYKRFGQIAFDVKSQELTERINIFLNGCDLVLVNGLETKLSDGDTLTLVPVITGG